MEKFTKIIATIGPSTDSILMIKKLYKEGMNVARLNFSHGDNKYFKNVINNIHKVSNEIAILLDTKGPEIRSGEIEEGSVMLNGGDKIILTKKVVPGNKKILTINYHKLYKIEVGNKLLIDDGLIALEIVERFPDGLKAKVLNGGILSSNKTVCIQGHNVELPFMNNKDKKDILFGIKNGVDYIAASFVRKKEDVHELKSILKWYNSNVLVISKIEHWEAVNNIDEIIQESDGIMIARGDLGVEIEMEKVPTIQANTITACNELGKPVIVATQMLESMKENPRPTRAEVSDISQAILQGADAVMLSGETANGKYPIESVKRMAAIAKEYDSKVKNKIEDYIHYPEEVEKNKIALFVTKAAFHASNQLKTKAIMTPTESGFTARKVSRFKPKCKIIAMVPTMTVLRQLQISWGVFPVFIKESFLDADDLIVHFIKHTYKKKMIEKEDMVVITAGYKLAKGTTNLLEIYHVKDVIK